MRQLRRLGVLVTTGESDPEWKTERTAFLEAMQSLGWTDGTNVRIDYRFAAGDRDRLAASGKELVGLKPDVLLARSTTAVRALLAETGTIPIVFVSVSDRREPRPTRQQRHRRLCGQTVWSGPLSRRGACPPPAGLERVLH